MLTHYRKPVSLSVVSTDLPIRSLIETAATVYQKDRERFHLLLHEPEIVEGSPLDPVPLTTQQMGANKPRLLWLEVSPNRAVMTMQGNSHFSYRHLWQKGVYGLSRYYLQMEAGNLPSQLRLRNFTRDFQLTGYPQPEHLRLEYELWSQKVCLGRYVLNLEVHH
ncbi:MAG: hypothetical protein WBA13_17250 [Microcoleaceae cyanobacterium]